MRRELLEQSSYDVFASILHSASKNKDGVKLTTIMDDSFLSYMQVSAHVRKLMSFGLLVNEPEITRYRITRKGLRFLELFISMNDLIKNNYSL